jgi:hypothetical protein
MIAQVNVPAGLLPGQILRTPEDMT